MTTPPADPVGPRPDWADVVDERVAKGHAPGMVALAATSDDVQIWAAGWQDVQRGKPMVADSLFRIASVSKMVTAVAALTLVDGGLVELDEPVGRWLPELANASVVSDLYGPAAVTRPALEPITLRHLLSMTNGMGAYFGQDRYSELVAEIQQRNATSWTARTRPDELMASIADLPLMFDPGARWLYHLGLELAGILVERVTGLRLGEYMWERIFLPLGMTDTGFFVAATSEPRLATLYAQAGPGRYRAIPDWEPDRTVAPLMDRGGGGLISSARDLGKFGRLFLNANQVVLSPASIAEMTRNQVAAEAQAKSPVFAGFWDDFDFGLGVCIAKQPNAVSSTPGRFGWWGGTGTALFIDPARDVAMVSLTQRMIERLDDSANADTVMAAVLSD